MKAKPSQLTAYGLHSSRNGSVSTAEEVLSNNNIKLSDCITLWPKIAEIPRNIHMQIETDCRYANYVKRQEADIAAMRRDDALEIPEDTEFSKIGGLSNESIELFNRFRPSSIGQANRVPGLTPAAVVCVLRYIRQNPKTTRTTSKNNSFVG